jgi:pimeloyl-ACP methyl ester carboxylesterase
MRKKRFTLDQAKAVGKQLGIKWDKFALEQFRVGLGVELEYGIVNPTTNLTNDEPLSSQFFQDLTTPFFGANRPGAKVSQGVRDAFWFRAMQGGLKNQLDCIKAFSETDFIEDIKKFDVPTLIIHGDDDQIVPIGVSAHASAKLIKHATLKVYHGASHGVADTHKDQLNADLLAFLKT